MSDSETNTTHTGTGAGKAPAPAPTVWPVLQAHDAHALIDFLVEKIGFLRTAVYEDGGQVAHCQLDWPEGGGIMLGSYKPDTEWSRPPGTFGAYVVTNDVDGLYERVKAAGVTFTRELSDQDYGNREFTISDPEGNLWSFGYYPGEPKP
ncbi:glyoxalase [Streptomyces abyssalis]|uniref:Glyoxalase n=1 Tax=Streptomyces abyssalis TaxID=933944 RepID=A0A1E7JNY7_9ACTN|nr:VOC family protein [Streptomyces abyssalis]OEU86649.1 glyoxalase [Streptomyces abyssalis]OEU89963.1 glyoxalase [Streptomyces abyssalis]OEV29404.1 glyoxalase [Streptomyces nanshensis]